MEREYLIQQFVNHPEAHKFSSNAFTQNVYAALCNNDFSYNGEVLSFSWRAAGGFVADIRNKLFYLSEDYMDYYCSGIPVEYDLKSTPGFFPEGFITDEVEDFFRVLGIELIKHYEGDI